jgi:hypothetical protein
MTRDVYFENSVPAKIFTYGIGDKTGPGAADGTAVVSAVCVRRKYRLSPTPETAAYTDRTPDEHGKSY